MINDIPLQYIIESSKIFKNNPQICHETKNKMIKILKEYGSIEFIINVIVRIADRQYVSHAHYSDPIAESPIIPFVSGMFLTYNNLEIKHVSLKIIEDFIKTAGDYFMYFKLDLGNKKENELEEVHMLKVRAKFEKIMKDFCPKNFPHQYYDYMEYVFSPLKNQLNIKYGFIISDAMKFNKILREKFWESILNNNNKKYQNNSLIIDINEYHKIYNLNKQKLRNYLSTFSCQLGEQHDEFNDPLSKNKIFDKPVIKLNINKFVILNVNFFMYTLDAHLEYIIKSNKESDKNTWDKFVKLRSKYIEDRTYEYFSRIFPNDAILRNIYYNDDNNQPREIDLLVIYDNKIYIIESKSGGIPQSVLSDGTYLEKYLENILKKAKDQTSNVKKYIQTKSTIKFYNSKNDTILHGIDNNRTYEYFSIYITRESLGQFSANLHTLSPYNFFNTNEYPLCISITDLDFITDLLDDLLYFIHYIKKRLIIQYDNSITMMRELEFLKYYMKIGGVITMDCHYNDSSVHRTLLTKSFDPIEKYYTKMIQKPKLSIPSNLKKLLSDIKNYHEYKFTDVTNLLLEFPYDKQKNINKKIHENNKKIFQNKTNKNFFIFDNKLSIGFSYYAFNEITDKLTNKIYIKFIKQKKKHNLDKCTCIIYNSLSKKIHHIFYE